jgi:toxin FitB
MPARDSQPDALADTSVAVALVVVDHEHHVSTVKAIGERTVGLAGQAGFETYSVLTRLPPPLRRTPRAVHRLLAANFTSSYFPSAETLTRLLADLAGAGIAGGAVYDALVGAAAAEHGIRLVTRDKRAAATYRVLGIDFELLS